MNYDTISEIFGKQKSVVRRFIWSLEVRKFHIVCFGYFLHDLNTTIRRQNTFSIYWDNTGHSYIKCLHDEIHKNINELFPFQPMLSYFPIEHLPLQLTKYCEENDI